MTLKMNWDDATFKASDVIKIVGGVIIAAFAWATLKSDVGNMNTSVKIMSESVSDIRATQVENTKKNEIRWQMYESRLSQIESDQRMQSLRLDNLEKKNR